LGRKNAIGLDVLVGWSTHAIESGAKTTDECGIAIEAQGGRLLELPASDLRVDDGFFDIQPVRGRLQTPLGGHAQAVHP